MSFPNLPYKLQAKLRRIARHEGGHFLACLAFGVRARAGVFISRDGSWCRGLCRHSDCDRLTSSIIGISGPLAERSFTEPGILEDARALRQWFYGLPVSPPYPLSADLNGILCLPPRTGWICATAAAGLLRSHRQRLICLAEQLIVNCIELTAAAPPDPALLGTYIPLDPPR